MNGAWPPLQETPKLRGSRYFESDSKGEWEVHSILPGLQKNGSYLVSEYINSSRRSIIDSPVEQLHKFTISTVSKQGRALPSAYIILRAIYTVIQEKAICILAQQYSAPYLTVIIFTPGIGYKRYGSSYI